MAKIKAIAIGSDRIDLISKEDVEALIAPKLDKVVPELIAGQDYKIGEVGRVGGKLVRVITDITGYDADNDKHKVVILLDEQSHALLAYEQNGKVKTGAYIFKDGVIYKAKEDIDAVIEDNFTDGKSFDEVYKPTDYTLTPATTTDLGGVKVSDGLSITGDGALSVDKTKLPVLVYQDANQVIPQGTLVIHANKLYICKTEVADTAGWVTDEAFMEPVDTDTHVIDIVDYDALTDGDEIEKGKIVVSQERIYLSKETFTKTAVFDNDKAHLIETALQIDLEKYYKKDEVDVLLKEKAPLVLPTVTDGQAYKANQLAVKDNLLVRVKEEITAYDAGQDADKLESVGYLPTATANVLGGIKLGNGLEDKRTDGVVSTKVNETDGYLTVDDKGLNIDKTKVQPKLVAGNGVEIDDTTNTISSKVKSITEQGYTDLADKGDYIYIIKDN